MRAILGLFLVGTAVNLYFGRIGLMPLDQSIVFDAAWRLSSGQIPFRDFAAPNSVVPALMQVPFFAGLGVSWFAYCLHSSLINGAFAVASYLLVIEAGASRLEAWLFSALGVLFFYPPQGTPFMDQHAFFFSTLMLYAVTIAARAAEGGRRRVAIAVVPMLFALGYLSKQIPTAFAGLFAAVGLLGLVPLRQVWKPLLIGLAGVASVLLFVGFAIGVDWSSAFDYLVRKPLAIGTDRSTGRGMLAPVRLVLGTLLRMPAAVNLWSLAVAPIVLMVSLVGCGSRDGRLRAWLLASVTLTMAGFLAFTINQAETGVGLVMLALGLSAVILRIELHRVPVPLSAQRWISALVICVIAVIAVRDSWRFGVDVDWRRSGLDRRGTEAAADLPKGQLPAALRFLRWTDIAAYQPQELTALTDYLRNAPGNFVLLGDSAFLYGITGKPSVSPSLWFHPGLSLPTPGTGEFDLYETQLLERMRALDVRRVVIDRNARGMTLADFPQLSATVQSRSCGERRFGVPRVVELCESQRLP